MVLDYAASLGRYIEADPIGLIGGLNPYSYAGNDPFTFSDPSGLTYRDDWTLQGALIGGKGGAVVGALAAAGGALLADGATSGFNSFATPGEIVLGTAEGGFTGAGLGGLIGYGAGSVVDATSAVWDWINHTTWNNNADDPAVYPDNPDEAPDSFETINGRKGKQCDDGSVWEKDRSRHGGEQWKRWPDRRSYDKGDTPQSIWPDGRIRK